MSGNQSRFEKTDYRNPNRSGNSSGTYQRSYSNKNSGGAAAGSGPPPPISSNRSFKKTYNVQGGQSVANSQAAVVAPSHIQHSAQHMGVTEQQHQCGTAGTAVSDVSSQASESSSSQRSNRVVPKAPFQSPAVSSVAKPTTPVKEVAAKPIAVQFGSLSPGFVNGMQIPARTSSAPPNMDEQKRNQARTDSFRAVPTAPVPVVPKPQVPEKEAGASKQARVEPHSVSRLKKENQDSSVPSSSLPQKPSTIPMSVIPMQMPFQQQQIHLPYGVPNPPVQSQVVPGASMHVPLSMHYHMGNAPQLQRQMFMPNLQTHPMQHQGLVHQGQGMSFPAQIGPHISHQLGNLGMNAPPQYAVQQAGKFAAPRKAVVITHPDTREELKLDKRGDNNGEGGLQSIRSQSNVSAKSQTIPTYTAGPSPNLYANTFNSYPYFVPSGSLSGTKAQGTPSSHAPKFNPVSQGPPVSGHETPSFVGKVAISAPAPRVLVKTEQGHDTQGAGAAVSASKKANAGYNNTSGQSLFTVAIKDESPKLMALGDAKQDIPIVDLGKASTNLNQDSKCSDELSTVPVRPVTAATTKDSSSVKRSVEQNSDDSTDNPLKKPEEKGSAQDEPQGSDLSASTPSPLGIIVDIKTSRSETSGNVDNKSDVSSAKTLDEKSTCSHEPPSRGHTSSEELPGFNALKEMKPLSRYVDEVTDQKNELPTNSTEEQKGSKDSDSGTYTNDIELDNLEVSMKSDVPNADLALINKEGDAKCFIDVVPSFSVTDSKGKLVPDQSRPKSASSKGKHKQKELFEKADAAGTAFDLYNAYKAPEEHKEACLSPESETDIVMNDIQTTGGDAVTVHSDTRGDGSQGKGGPVGWEDAADVATPKVGTPDNGEQHGELIQHDSEILSKNYSRDFLLKFQSQNYDLPDGFIVAPSVANVLLIPNADKGNLNRDSYPSPVRHTGGGSRLDRHGPAMDDDKWSKAQGNFVHNRDHANSVGGFRHAQGGNFGMLKNPRQTPGHATGFNHSGPPQSMNTMHRSNTEADKWQRGSNFQKGLIPPPQTPSQLIHKAEKKYEVGKVADEEQTKQRRLKGILNKLTPQNFEKLFEQVKAVNIDSVVTLTGVISQIFDKALTEPTFCEMYADFCYHLSEVLPDFSEENEKITFKRILLNKCQEEFERGEREQEEANRSEDSEITQTKEEREERRVQARRRMLGNIRLIGELFKKKMLTERIMHECIKKLLGQQQNPDEEDLESLCKLMSTIGEMIDRPVAKPFMDAYFEMMGKLSNDMNLSSRVRFMLKDAIDLRRNKWQQRRKVEGPKKIEEVHRDAAHERQAQANRLARGSGINASGRRGHPPDFGSRGSNTMPSPNSHLGNIRGYPSQSRGHGNHDNRSEDRQPSFESRTLSVPLRTARDDTITLGPQGGLARGMSNRGSVSLASGTPTDRPLSSGESRRAEGIYNGNNSVTEWPTSNSSEDTVGRFVPERTHDRPGGQHRNIPSDRESTNASSFDKTSSPSPEKTFSVERLEEMSSAAIKEFYSAKDEKEVTLCITELNSPSFYPSMIALWVTDSLERKDMHRDLLTRLLINLSKPSSGILSQQDLIKGFELVLSTLEDAVNDAPRAPEFLGHILAKTITENLTSLADISRILHEGGGEEPGTLLESGLAGDVLGIILESIQTDKGDSFLNQILSSTNLQLQDFQPPGSMKSKKLEKFIK